MEGYYPTRATMDGGPALPVGKGKLKGAHFDLPRLITAFEDVAYVYQRAGTMRKVVLKGDRRGLVTTLTHKFCNFKSFVLLNRVTLAIVDANSLNLVDVGPTINCRAYNARFITQDLQGLRVSKANRVDLYEAFSGGLELDLELDATSSEEKLITKTRAISNGVWSFTAYRKSSSMKGTYPLHMLHRLWLDC